MRASVLLVLLMACGGSAAVPAPGSERGVCAADRTCETGLECWSDRCVRPPAADCAAVAERLASVKLGNYARREERAPLVGQLAAQCQRERLTQAEGQCLVAAPDLAALDRCPRALLPDLGGDRKRCAAIGERAGAFLNTAAGGDDPWQEAASGAASSPIAAAVTAACVEDRWSDAVKECALAADDGRDAQACARQLSPAARAALEARLKPLVTAAVVQHSSSPWAGFAPLVAPFVSGDPSPPAEAHEEDPDVPDTHAPPGATGLPAACARLIKAMDAYGTCSQVPAEARASIQQARDQIQASWSAAAGVPESRAAMEQGCRDAEQSVVQAMTAIGCAPPS